MSGMRRARVLSNVRMMTVRGRGGGMYVSSLRGGPTVAVTGMRRTLELAGLTMAMDGVYLECLAVTGMRRARAVANVRMVVARGRLSW